MEKLMFLRQRSGHNETLLKKIELSADMQHRAALPKYGQSAGLPHGPDADSTTLGDNVFLELEKVQQAVRAKIICRRCQGGHWTNACPFKDTMDAPAVVVARAAPAAGKYVPPNLRQGNTLAPAGASRDDPNTIRIANLSEETTEQDVRELVDRFGLVSRVFVSRDRDYGFCKGYAFVTFAARSSAEQCIGKLDGFGYASLILQVDFARR